MAKLKPGSFYIPSSKENTPMKVSSIYFSELLLYCVSCQAKPVQTPNTNKKPGAQNPNPSKKPVGFMSKPLYPTGYLAQQKMDKLKLKKPVPKPKQVCFTAISQPLTYVCVNRLCLSPTNPWRTLDSPVPSRYSHSK